MVRLIFIKELHYYILNRRLLISWIILFILMIVNILVSINDYSNKKEQFNKLIIENQKNLETINSSNILDKIFDPSIGKAISLADIIFVNQQIPKKPSNLSFISSWSTSVFPDGIEINFFREFFPKFYLKNNEYFPKIIAFDWKNITLYLISFLCFAFSFNAFSEEKENGTLKLMLANNASRGKIFIGKFLSLLIIIIIPLLIGVIFSLVFFSSIFELNTPEYVNILFFILLYAIFISFNILLGFFISILSKRSDVSLNICLVVWIMFIAVIPNLGWMISKTLLKTETISNVNIKCEKIREQIFKEYKISWDDNWIGVKPPTEGVYNISEAFNKITHAQNKIWRQHRNNLFNQAKNAVLISKISPFCIFDYCCDVISDNNIPGIENFYLQGLNYAREYRDCIINKDLADKNSYHLIWDHYGKINTFITDQKISFGDVPLFSYQQSQLSDIISKIKIDLYIFIFYCLLLFILGYYSFLKLDVR